MSRKSAGYISREIASRSGHKLELSGYAGGLVFVDVLDPEGFSLGNLDLTPAQARRLSGLLLAMARVAEGG